MKGGDPVKTLTLTLDTLLDPSLTLTTQRRIPTLMKSRMLGLGYGCSLGCVPFWILH